MRPRPRPQAFGPACAAGPSWPPALGAASWSTEDASRILALQAARLIDEPDAWSEEGPGAAQIAARLGVSDRHLRRIFEAQFGVSPLQYLQTRRLLAAKQLIADTRLPMTQVALASGFASVRRFNAAFRGALRAQPERAAARRRRHRRGRRRQGHRGAAGLPPALRRQRHAGLLRAACAARRRDRIHRRRQGARQGQHAHLRAAGPHPARRSKAGRRTRAGCSCASTSNASSCCWP